LPAHNVGQLRPIPVRADHDLKRAIAVHAAKVEVALGRHVGDVGRYAPLLAELVYLGRGGRVVDGAEHHVDVVEVGGLKGARDVGDLGEGGAVGDFGIEAVAGTYYCDFGVGIEDVEDASCGYLCRVLTRWSSIGELERWVDLLRRLLRPVCACCGLARLVIVSRLPGLRGICSSSLWCGEHWT
jgi:hypothetical protein